MILALFLGSANTLIVPKELYDIVYDKDNKRFLLCGNDKGKRYNNYKSLIIDEETMSIRTILNDVYFKSICKGNNKIVAVNDKRLYIFSNEGELIQIVSPSSLTGYPKKIRYYNGKYYAICKYGKIYTSNDAITWEKKNSNTTVDLYDIECTNTGRVVAVGKNGNIVYSDDEGETWNKIIIYFGSSGKYNEISYDKVNNELLCVKTCKNWTYNGVDVIDATTMIKKISRRYSNDSRDYRSNIIAETNGYLTIVSNSKDVSHYESNFKYSDGILETVILGGATGNKNRLSHACFGTTRVLMKMYDSRALKYNRISSTEA